MKRILLKLSIIGIVFGLDLLVSAPTSRSQQADLKYECVTRNNVPVTIVSTPTGEIELIKWRSTYFSNSSWTPERRCKAVSERFQVHSDTGKLRYVTYGKMNKQTVICVGIKNNQPKKPYQCHQDEITVDRKNFDSVLITLQPQDYAPKVLQ